MIVEGTGHIDHAYSLADKCSSSERQLLGIALDLDEDGTNDCDKPKWKRTYYAFLTEKGAGGQSLAVASVHYVLDEFLKDKATGRAMKAQWSEELVTALRLAAPPQVSSFAIGGDFNQGKCLPLDPAVSVSTPLDAPRESNTCPPTPMWQKFASLGYADAIFTLHGQTNPRLDDQYRDGYLGRGPSINYRKKRIDHIFVHGAWAPSSASFDLSCGITAPVSFDMNCNEFETHPDAYSDHSLLWTYIGPVPRTPSAPPPS
jgi:hypothetical protein